MSRRRLAALVAAVLLQLAVLGGLFVYSQYPLWVGTEVRLATVPVDPRDLFRGQYVRLNYALSRQPLPEMELPGVRALAAGRRAVAGGRRAFTGTGRRAAVSARYH